VGPVSPDRYVPHTSQPTYTEVKRVNYVGIDIGKSKSPLKQLKIFGTVQSLKTGKLVS
jgi:hypothetical protein